MDYDLPKTLASMTTDEVKQHRNLICDRTALRKFVSNHPFMKQLGDAGTVIDASPMLSLDGEPGTVQVRSATWPSIFSVMTVEALRLAAMEYGFCDAYWGTEDDRSLLVRNILVATLVDPIKYGLPDQSTKSGYLVGVWNGVIPETCKILLQGKGAPTYDANHPGNAHWSECMEGSLDRPTPTSYWNAHTPYKQWVEYRDGPVTESQSTSTGQSTTTPSSGPLTFDASLKKILNDMFQQTTGSTDDLETLLNTKDKIIEESGQCIHDLMKENKFWEGEVASREEVIKALNAKVSVVSRPSSTAAVSTERPAATITWTPTWKVFAPQHVKDMMNAHPGSPAPSGFAFDVPVYDYGGKKHADVPEIDPDYEFDMKVLGPLLWGLVNNKPVYIQGHTGTGKTSIVHQVAARLGWPIVRVNMDSEMSRMDFIGRDVLTQENGTTVSKFVEGILPQAMQQGCILEADEVDFGRSDIMYAFQSVLENGGSLRITEDGGRVIQPHDMFRIVATANTKGQGDETGCYQGARVQSQAFLDRFQVWVTQEYLNPEKEHKIIKKKVPAIGEKPLTQLIRVAGEIRKAFMQGEVLTTVSPRGLETCAMYFTALGGTDDNLKDAVRHCISGRCTDVDAMKVEEFIKAHIG